MPSDPDDECASLSPPRDGEAAYCNRGLEALESLAHEMSARPGAALKREGELKAGALTAVGAFQSAHRSREETDIGVHYRHPGAVASDLYTDSSTAGATPSPIRRVHAVTTTSSGAVAPAKTAAVNPTLTRPQPPPKPFYSARAKVPASQLWSNATTTQAAANHPGGNTTVAASTKAVTETAPISIWDFYGARQTAAAGVATTARTQPRRGSGALHHDAVQLTNTVTTVNAPNAATRVDVVEDKTKSKPGYYVNDGKHTIEVLPSSQSSSSTSADRKDTGGVAVADPKTMPSAPHRARDRSAADTRTRSAPVAAEKRKRTRADASGARGKSEKPRSRSNSSPRSFKRRPYQRSRSSSNEETEEGTSSKASQPTQASGPAARATADGPKEILCTRTATTGAATDFGACQRANQQQAPHKTENEGKAREQAPPTPYPRANRNGLVDTRARGEPPGRTDPAPATRAAAPAHPPSPTRQPQTSHSPQVHPQSRAPLPVPLGPPVWVAFPRQAFGSGPAAAAPLPPRLRHLLHTHPLDAARLQASAATTATPAPAPALVPNDYNNFHPLPLTGAGDLQTWGRPAPMVMPGRLKPLTGPRQAAAGYVSHSANGAQHRPHGHVAPHTQRRGQPSPQSEMRLSCSEVYQPLGLPVASSPSGALRVSLDPEHPLHDPLERLDSARLLRRPLSRSNSDGVGAGHSGTRQRSPRGGGFYRPWTTAPSVMQTTADGDRSAALSGLSKLARLVVAAPPGSHAPDARPHQNAHDQTAAFALHPGTHPLPEPAAAPVTAANNIALSARARPHLAPLPASTGAPVQRALDFDARPASAATVASPTGEMQTPLEARLPPAQAARPPTVSLTPSPSPSQPTAGAAAAADVLGVRMCTGDLDSGGVVAEHIPPAFPTASGRGGSIQSHVFSAPPLFVAASPTTTPSSISSVRPVLYQFTASPSAPATAGQPVGALQTASVGPSSTTASSRHSGGTLSHEEAGQTPTRDTQPLRLPPPAAESVAGSALHNTAYYVSPRQPLPPPPKMTAPASPVRTTTSHTDTNGSKANYYGAFHAARLRPAPAVSSKRTTTAATRRPASPSPIPPPSGSAQTSARVALPAHIPAPADPVHVSPCRLQQPPPTTTTAAAVDARLLPAPCPRLDIPNDIELPDPPVRPADTDAGPTQHAPPPSASAPHHHPHQPHGRSAIRGSGGFGQRLKRKLFRRRGRAADVGQNPPHAAPSRKEANRKAYKPMRRSGSEDTEVPAPQDEDAWETIPDQNEARPLQQRDQNARPKAVPSLFPASHVRQAVGTTATPVVTRRDLNTLHSTTLTPVKKRRNRAFPWTR